MWGGTAGIQHGFDGAEFELASGAERDAAKALKGGVGARAVARVVVMARFVALPNFYSAAFERFSFGVCHRAFHPHRRSFGVAKRAVLQQVIVCVFGLYRRVKRALGGCCRGA